MESCSSRLPQTRPPHRAAVVSTPIDVADRPIAEPAARSRVRSGNDGQARDPEQPDLLRLFYAAELDPASRAVAGGIQRDLRRSGLKARWVGPDDLHLTLRFLGPSAPTQLPALQVLLQEVAVEHPAHTLSADKIEQWGKLLVATFAPAPPLTALVAALERGVQRLGYRAEARVFRPHVTLARAEHAGIETPRARARIDAPAWPLPISQVALYLSAPGPSRPRYRTLDRRLLSGCRP